MESRRGVAMADEMEVFFDAVMGGTYGEAIERQEARGQTRNKLKGY